MEITHCGDKKELPCNSDGNFYLFSLLFDLGVPNSCLIGVYDNNFISREK